MSKEGQGRVRKYHVTRVRGDFLRKAILKRKFRDK